MLTADAGGTVRCWSLVEASSELNNNEAVTANEHYTWTCTWQTRHDHETLSGLAFAHDGSVYAMGLFSTVALYEAATHALCEENVASVIDAMQKSGHLIRVR